MPQQLLGTALVDDGPGVDLARHLKRHAGRNVGLDQTGDHIHRRTLGRENQVNARRPGLLRNAGNQLFHLLADDHHHVGKFVDHHDDGRQFGQQRRFVVDAFALVQRIGQRLARFLGVLDLLVEAREVTHAHLGHQLVATLHLRHAPAQGVGGVFHVGHYRAQQVRDTFVNRQFEHFRVNHDQLGVFRARLEQDRQDHCVDAYRLTGTRSTGYQQVRHFRQIGNHRFAADVMPQGQGNRRLGIIKFGGRQHFAEAHDLAVFVRDLDTHGGFTRNDFNHPHAGYRQRTSKVLGQVGNATDFDACCGLNLVTGNDRARVDGVHRDLYAELLELDLEQMPHRRQ